MLKGKTILLGVTGSIAAYKSVELVRRLRDEGAQVKVVMTEAATRFVSTLTFEAVSNCGVGTNMFLNPFSHITLSEEAHLFIVAPATANTIAKFSCGIADNLLTALWLSYSGPAIIAPAMNWRMFENSITKMHINNLKKLGVTFVGPCVGSLACGEEERVGRLAEVPEIIEQASLLLSHKDFFGQKIVVTAGPTREHIDPVRFLSNRSSGKMGFAIARMALRRGAEVTIISGPTQEKPPPGAAFVSVESAREMEEAIELSIHNKHVLIMAAAVADFRPANPRKFKAKKEDIESLSLERTTDILRMVGQKKGNLIVVGFAAETGDAVEKAKEKLNKKNLDLIVVNDVSLKGAGFDVDTNIVTLIDRDGQLVNYPLMKKEEVANIILDKIRQIQHKQQS